MRIAVEATSWHNNRGYGRHARALLGSLIALDTANEYTLFFDCDGGAGTLPSRAAVRKLQAAKPASVAASANGHRSVTDMWAMSRALSSREFDLVLFPTIYSYVPVWTRARKLVVIHDVIAETYPKLTVPKAGARFFWNLKVGVGRRQADALVTVSEFSKEGIVRHFGVPPDRVHVVGEASDPVFRLLDRAQVTPRLAKAGIDAAQRMVVYVGGFGPHKNIEALVDAFAACAAGPGWQDVRLVLVGEYRKEVFHSVYAELEARIHKRGIADQVIFTGYLPDEDLVHLLNMSSVLVLPSLMEGFGLPAVEAAACGCPVIATKQSPLPELLGEGGIYIDPQSDDLQGALRRVVNSPDLRAWMKAAGLVAARKLTWNAAAAQMQSVIRKVAEA